MRLNRMNESRQMRRCMEINIHLESTIRPRDCMSIYPRVELEPTIGQDLKRREERGPAPLPLQGGGWTLAVPHAHTHQVLVTRTEAAGTSPVRGGTHESALPMRYLTGWE
eukprot:GHVU01176706.1.p2 GENE.GHVU01176706.1~~GHVU01176706.1.p2  ORF type:complete len:110 (-),score=7.07 GHVU01176706.1:200-529(-)